MTPSDPAARALRDRTRWPLSAPLTLLRGVGPVVRDRLGAVGLRTVRDLLLYFPRRHQEVIELESPDEAALGRLVRLSGRVVRCSRAWLPGRRSVVNVRFAAADGTAFLVRFFNQPYLANTYAPGVERQLEGTLERSGRQFVLGSARVVSPGMRAEGPCIVRYGDIEGVSEQRLRTWIHEALARAELDDDIDEGLPAAIEEGFPSAAQAVRAMHAPASLVEHEAARRRFALLEAVRLFRAVELRRRAREACDGPRVPGGAEADRLRARCVPFEWTGDQARAVAALRRRLAGPAPMGVLLQGDVGTGKTAVALDAALCTVAAGYQAAFLAPTELLAEQHFAVLQTWLEDAGIELALLTGSLAAAERRQVEESVAGGSARIVVGTHALLSPATTFARLGLVIVDEQHRFGVEQRTRLVGKGERPHVLVMTATPIPRTLTLSLFGDLDIETLRERPLGRRPVPAVFVETRAWPRVLRAIRRRNARGERVFVVCPKVGEDGSKGGVRRVYDELSRDFECGLVHGRMPVAKRQAATDAFRAGEFGVLCGTTVLEVGIDVPEATLMIVVRAERFGLATLHQLRGRVGRGPRRGLCILTGEPNPRTEIVCATVDGFEIAEHDLRHRGAGELLGRSQSGAIDFRALDPLEDFELLKTARAAVREE